MKHIILVIAAFCASLSVWGQNGVADFELFLSQLGELSGNIGQPREKLKGSADDEIAGKFAPNVGRSNLGELDTFWWRCGGYIRVDSKILLLFFTRHCEQYQDAYSKYVMDYFVGEHYLVTYTVVGKLVDYKMVGRSNGNTTYIFHMDRYNKEKRSFDVDGGSLDDPTQLRKYENFVFTALRKRYTIGQNGVINVKTMGKERKVSLPNKEADYSRLTFDEFRGCFSAWEKPYVNDSVFYSGKVCEVSQPSLMGIYAKAANCDCWPKDFTISPGCCIETANMLYFFIKGNCEYPQNEEADRYDDYVFLQFDKKGKFQKLWDVARLPSDVTEKERGEQKIYVAKAVKEIYEQIKNDRTSTGKL